MRGKGWSGGRKNAALGITPAYAGKRKHFVVGESDLTGSPPPMRGKVCASSGFSRITRITPAYAGKSYNLVPP